MSILRPAARAVEPPPPPPSPRLTFRGAIPRTRSGTSFSPRTTAAGRSAEKEPKMTSFGSRDPVHGGRAGIDGRGGRHSHRPRTQECRPISRERRGRTRAFLPPRPDGLATSLPGPSAPSTPVGTGGKSAQVGPPPPPLASSSSGRAVRLRSPPSASRPSPGPPSPVAASVVCGVASSDTLSSPCSMLDGRVRELPPGRIVPAGLGLLMNQPHPCRHPSPHEVVQLLIGAGRVATPFSAATRLLHASLGPT
ncbi:hypothetical protein THAOC_12100 [Thalassiosira oceanica]|uniref:Uncharacterized protein n=1 Tax=Thalassiosira oceanica TaxID=159749 RepID=K0T8S1_THAOC|nr:hypothetical protein THAOC_12100 [Thalassiosira oceanica]|eukprot:EJK66927.1 hypothetical protein THAOC_12100 [Thalassiosira oceanica]